jgi:acetoin utilization deacetylase AcuC-like enzyme
MKLFYSDTFSFPLPPDHRFPLSKYALLRERLLASGWLNPDDLIIPAPASDKQLLRVHTPEYFARVLEGTLDTREVRRIGLPWSPELVLRSRHSVGALSRLLTPHWN